MLRKLTMLVLVLALGLIAAAPTSAGATTANGWNEGEEIYYILGGVEEGVTRWRPQVSGQRRRIHPR